jgi:hypothetical protein
MNAPHRRHDQYNRFKYYSALRTGFRHLIMSSVGSDDEGEYDGYQHAH